MSLLADPIDDTRNDSIDGPIDGEAVAATPLKDWWAKARCNDGNATITHLFFSEDLIDIARAKAICSKCPVADTCLTEALERREPWGVWGGQLLVDGRILAHKRRRGRPPKHPRPEPAVDEVLPLEWLVPARTA